MNGLVRKDLTAWMIGDRIVEEFDGNNERIGGEICDKDDRLNIGFDFDVDE